MISKISISGRVCKSCTSLIFLQYVGGSLNFSFFESKIHITVIFLDPKALFKYLLAKLLPFRTVIISLFSKSSSSNLRACLFNSNVIIASSVCPSTIIAIKSLFIVLCYPPFSCLL